MICGWEDSKSEYRRLVMLDVDTQRRKEKSTLSCLQFSMCDQYNGRRPTRQQHLVADAIGSGVSIKEKERRELRAEARQSLHTAHFLFLNKCRSTAKIFSHAPPCTTIHQGDSVTTPTTASLNSPLLYARITSVLRTWR